MSSGTKRAASETSTRAIRSHVVIELREGREDTFHQLSVEVSSIDRFCRRAQ
jgi:hypothetical protein